VLERWTFVDVTRSTTKPPCAFTYSRIKQEGFQLLEGSCDEGEQLDADDKRLPAGESSEKTAKVPR
jgi:hypothetical protein